MDTVYEVRDGKLIIMAPKELDHHQAGRLRSDADLLLEMYHIKHLEFDFTDTEFMDSSGIGVLIGRYKNVRFKGGTISARGLNPRVSKIFEVSGLGKIIRIEKE